MYANHRYTRIPVYMYVVRVCVHAVLPYYWHATKCDLAARCTEDNNIIINNMPTMYLYYSRGDYVLAGSNYNKD